MVEESLEEKDNDGGKREIGKLAVWSVSSFKPGNGVDLLRDSNIETYWQFVILSLSLPQFGVVYLNVDCICVQTIFSWFSYLSVQWVLKWVSSLLLS
jgi:hypothetical protein